MTITRDTSISEIKEILSLEHCVRYNTIKIDTPLVLSQKHNSFGSYIFIHQGEGILISVKCSSDYESKLLCKQLVAKALEELGYQVSDN